MSYRTNCDFTVIKVPMSRIPENRVETILASCNSLDSRSCYPEGAPNENIVQNY